MTGLPKKKKNCPQTNKERKKQYELPIASVYMLTTLNSPPPERQQGLAAVIPCFYPAKQCHRQSFRLSTLAPKPLAQEKNENL